MTNECVCVCGGQNGYCKNDARRWDKNEINRETRCDVGVYQYTYTYTALPKSTQGIDNDVLECMYILVRSDACDIC